MAKWWERSTLRPKGRHRQNKTAIMDYPYIPRKLTLDEFHELAAVVDKMRPETGWFALEAIPKTYTARNLCGDEREYVYFDRVTLVYAEPAVNYCEERKTYDLTAVSPMRIALEVAAMSFSGIKQIPKHLKDEIFRIIQTL